MKKLSKSILILLIYSYQSKAVNQHFFDSLEAKLKTNISVSERVDALYNLSYQYGLINIKLAKKY